MKYALTQYQKSRKGVAPPVGAWIEIVTFLAFYRDGTVAPPVGAWIEIAAVITVSAALYVAPPVGAWIEIYRLLLLCKRAETSLPPWERGLKFFLQEKGSERNLRRSPRGSVD